MQKFKKIHQVDPGRNASQMNKQTDRWMDDGGLIMFFRNLRIKLS